MKKNNLLITTFLTMISLNSYAIPFAGEVPYNSPVGEDNWANWPNRATVLNNPQHSDAANEQVPEDWVDRDLPNLTPRNLYNQACRSVLPGPAAMVEVDGVNRPILQKIKTPARIVGNTEWTWNVQVRLNPFTWTGPALGNEVLTEPQIFILVSSSENNGTHIPNDQRGFGGASWAEYTGRSLGGKYLPPKNGMQDGSRHIGTYSVPETYAEFKNDSGWTQNYHYGRCSSKRQMNYVQVWAVSKQRRHSVYGSYDVTCVERAHRLSFEAIGGGAATVNNRNMWGNGLISGCSQRFQLNPNQMLPPKDRPTYLGKQVNGIGNCSDAYRKFCRWVQAENSQTMNYAYGSVTNRKGSWVCEDSNLCIKPTGGYFFQQKPDYVNGGHMLVCVPTYTSNMVGVPLNGGPRCQNNVHDDYPECDDNDIKYTPLPNPCASLN